MRRVFPRAAVTEPDVGGTAFDLSAVRAAVHDDDQSGEKIRAAPQTPAKRSNGAIFSNRNRRRRPRGSLSGAL